MVLSKGIHNYSHFVNHLDLVLQNYLISSSRDDWESDAIKCVNGLAAEQLRNLIDLDKRRACGAFFTDSALARLVLQKLNPNFDETSLIYDPAMGAGNLLIETFNFFNANRVTSINDQFLFGTDIHNEFVEAANIRLTINQLLSAPSELSFYQLNHPCFDIKTSSGLQNNDYYQKATHIFVNPPFNLVDSKNDITWASGKVSSAALFIDRIIQYINSGVRITAILPDVLRSGSRYERWRNMVLKQCKSEKVELLGQFDKYADVDVFAINLIKRTKNIFIKRNLERFQPKPRTQNKTVADLFEICVGPVVDNRDSHLGRKRGYIVSKGLLGWSTQTKYALTRRHNGRFFKSPFVVIKRTSRMGDSQRAIATIIDTPKPVFIDNHLLVLIPKSGRINDCRKLLTSLKDKRTDNWLNSEIRCRHLTVKVVSKIPLWE